MKEMGKEPCSGLLDRRYYHRFINRASAIPDNYVMSENGVFLRESVLDIPQVENLFVSPRAFNWHMTRKSSEEWELEQGRDNNNLLPMYSKDSVCQLSRQEKQQIAEYLYRTLHISECQIKRCLVM